MRQFILKVREVLFRWRLLDRDSFYLFMTDEELSAYWERVNGGVR